MIKSGILENKRLDGRQSQDMRTLKINPGPMGTCFVHLGQTKVIAHVSAEVVRPSSAFSTEGILSINTEFSLMAFPSSDGNKYSEIEVSLSRMLEKALRKAHALDTEGLCIIAGEKVWSIRVDVRVLDNDGNVFDCALVATLSALLHFKRPDVSIHSGQVTIHSADEKSLIGLSIHHIPICISFAIFDDGDKIIVDPCLDEEMIQSGQVSIVVNAHRELCTMFLSGVPVEPDVLLLCSNIAASKAVVVTKLIQEALKPDSDDEMQT